MSKSNNEGTTKNPSLNYENQAVSYIKEVITKEKIKSDLVEDVIHKFKHTEKLAILKQALNKEKPLDILFTNPILGYNNLLTNTEAEGFFKHQLLELSISQGGELVLRGAIWNIVSSKNFMNKVSDTAIRDVLKVYLDNKEVSKIKLLLSSPNILNKIDDKFIQKFLIDIKPYDFGIVNALFLNEGVNKKFNAYLTNKNGEELYKTFNEISYGLIPSVKKLISSDEAFKQKVLGIFNSKITSETLKEEITKANSAYVKLLGEVPELTNIVKSKISSLAVNIEKLNAKEVTNYLKGLHGEGVKIIFGLLDKKEYDQIINKIKSSISDKSIDQKNIGSWIISLNNEMVEVLAKENIIQNAFIEHIKTIEEKEIKYLSRQLINEGKPGLFKILAEAENGNFIESISLPGDLIFSATTNQKIESLEYLFRNEYFSGRSFESESPEQAQFFDKYLNALEAARVTKDFKSLQILIENFPNELEIESTQGTSQNDIKSNFNVYLCQLKDINQFDYHDAAQASAPKMLQESPDPCYNAPTFIQLANGAEIKPLSLADLNATLNHHIDQYEWFLQNDNIQFSPKEELNILSKDELKISQQDEPRHELKISQQGESKYDGGGGGYNILEIVASAAAVVYEAYGMTMHGTINQYCSSLHPPCSTKSHGNIHTHVQAFSKITQLFQIVQLTKVVVNSFDLATEFVLNKYGPVADYVALACPMLINMLLLKNVIGDQSPATKYAATFSVAVSLGSFSISQGEPILDFAKEVYNKLIYQNDSESTKQEIDEYQVNEARYGIE